MVSLLNIHLLNDLQRFSRQSDRQHCVEEDERA
jgi:hypothetical protein